MIKLIFVQNDKKFNVDVDEKSKKTLLDIAKENDIPLMGACEGSCACGTCHIYIDEEHLKKIEKPLEEEENVLDIVFNVQNNSRLACQVCVCKELDGAEITIA